MFFFNSAEHVQEVMLHVRDDIDIRPTARLDDFADIRNIVTKCGYKMRTAAAPGTVDESELKVEVGFTKLMIEVL